MPLIYTTWRISTERALKGDIQVGDIVAFRYPGGSTAVAELDTGMTFPKLRSGDKVVIFGFRSGAVR